MINKTNIFHDPMEEIIGDRLRIITPKQKETNMPKKQKSTDETKNHFKSIEHEVMANTHDEVLNKDDAKSAEEERKANEKRRKKLDKVSRRIKEVSNALKINDADKKHYGKKLNKCMKKEVKLRKELDELLKKEQELQ